MSAPPSFADQLHSLHSALHLSHTPQAMPCRDAQQAALRAFLARTAGEGRGGAMYISGAPGTGKTASTEHVVHEMYGQRFFADAHRTTTAEVGASAAEPRSKTKLLSKLSASSSAAATNASSSSVLHPSAPRVLYINAMTFAAKPSMLYPHLLARARGLDLAGELALPSPMECLGLLQEIFCPADAAAAAAAAAHAHSGGGMKKKSSSNSSSSSLSSRMSIVVLDEVDALLKGPNGAVLYHLLEWPRRPAARIVVLAISNSINLLEQKLPELARRNAMPENLLFPTYSKEELKRIVMERCDSIYALPPKEEEQKKEEQKEAARTSKLKETQEDEHVQLSGSKKKLKQQQQRPPASTSIAALVSSSPAKSAAPSPRKTATPSPISSTPSRATSLRSSPRTSPFSASTASAAAAAAAAAAASRGDVVVRSKRGAKRKSSTAVSMDAECEGDDAEMKRDDVEESSTSSVSIQHLRVRVDTPPSELDVDMENLQPQRHARDELCVTPKKKRRGAEQSMAASPTASPSSSTPASARASPSCSPHSNSSSPSSFLPASSPRAAALVSIAPSTRERPLFEEHALDFLCARVSKGSGDLRKVLEVMRKCIDGLALEAETIVMVAINQARAKAEGLLQSSPSASPIVAGAAAHEKQEQQQDEDEAACRIPSPLSECGSAAQQQQPSVHPSLQVSLPLMHGMLLGCLGGAGEQLSLLRSLPVQQKVLLTIGALLCHLHGGREQLHAFPKYYAKFSAAFSLEPLRGADFADLLAALAAHRLIKIEKPSVQRRARASGGSGHGGGGGGGGSGRSAPLSGGGGGGGGGSGRSRDLGHSSGALGAIQVQVTLPSLEAAFAEDALMQRLLTRGKALATSILAANKAAGEFKHEDYAPRNIEDP